MADDTAETPGAKLVWEWCQTFDLDVREYDYNDPEHRLHIRQGGCPPDLQPFMEADLAARVDALLAPLVDALEFYVDPSRYQMRMRYVDRTLVGVDDSEINIDRGKLATKALRTLRGGPAE